ncbi:hypothetical protein PR048_018659 [Dryococelus australis]|uniref:Uncharacterized protein n=1 Tax=Dryococelus australis TaxID=614101 RepID=A0ABQ9HDA6_9NEOP|nr:hypothetical protein PR048_018659 [Dryococelus australis]
MTDTPLLLTHTSEIEPDYGNRSQQPSEWLPLLPEHPGSSQQLLQPVSQLAVTSQNSRISETMSRPCPVTKEIPCSHQVRPKNGQHAGRDRYEIMFSPNKLNIIVNKLIALEETTASIEKKLSPSSVSEEDDGNFHLQLPFKAKDELEKCEQLLEDNTFYSKVVNFVKRIGGSDVQSLTVNILKNLLMHGTGYAGGELREIGVVGVMECRGFFGDGVLQGHWMKRRDLTMHGKVPTRPHVPRRLPSPRHRPIASAASLLKCTTLNQRLMGRLMMLIAASKSWAILTPFLASSTERVIAGARVSLHALRCLTEDFFHLVLFASAECTFNIPTDLHTLFMPHPLRSSAGMKRRGKRKIPEKIHRPVASSGTIPTCYKTLGMTLPGIEPWFALVKGEQANGSATAAPRCTLASSYQEIARQKKTKISTTQDESDTSDEEETNAGCIFCNDLYSNSKSEEGWIKCVVCDEWAHEQCAGIDIDDGWLTFAVTGVCLTSSTPHVRWAGLLVCKYGQLHASRLLGGPVSLQVWAGVTAFPSLVHHRAVTEVCLTSSTPHVCWAGLLVYKYGQIHASRPLGGPVSLQVWACMTAFPSLVRRLAVTGVCLTISTPHVRWAGLLVYKYGHLHASRPLGGPVSLQVWAGVTAFPSLVHHRAVTEVCLTSSTPHVCWAGLLVYKYGQIHASRPLGGPVSLQVWAGVTVFPSLVRRLAVTGVCLTISTPHVCWAGLLVYKYGQGSVFDDLHASRPLGGPVSLQVWACMTAFPSLVRRLAVTGVCLTSSTPHVRWAGLLVYKYGHLHASRLLGGPVSLQVWAGVTAFPSLVHHRAVTEVCLTSSTPHVCWAGLLVYKYGQFASMGRCDCLPLSRTSPCCDGGVFDELHASRPLGGPVSLQVWACMTAFHSLVRRLAVTGVCLTISTPHVCWAGLLVCKYGQLHASRLLGGPVSLQVWAGMTAFPSLVRRLAVTGVCLTSSTPHVCWAGLLVCKYGQLHASRPLGGPVSLQVWAGMTAFPSLVRRLAVTGVCLTSSTPHVRWAGLLVCKYGQLHASRPLGGPVSLEVWAGMTAFPSLVRRLAVTGVCLTSSMPHVRWAGLLVYKYGQLYASRLLGGPVSLQVRAGVTAFPSLVRHLAQATPASHVPLACPSRISTYRRTVFQIKTPTFRKQLRQGPRPVWVGKHRNMQY